MHITEQEPLHKGVCIHSSTANFSGQFLPMGNGEAATPSKTEKASSSVQTTVHPYPDWAAMQAYYGPGIAMPPPYFSTTVTAGHAPHPYVWGPQPLMPPFGAPYPAIYPAGVYAHPSLPLGGQAVVTSTASESATVTQETLTKSPSNKDNTLTKKLKGPDGLAGTVCNGRDKNEAEHAAHTQSQSTEGGTEGSSDGSDGNNNQAQRKRTLEDTAAGMPVVSGSVPGMDVRVSMAAKTKISALVPLPNSAIAPNRDGMHPEHWIQDERELKRERRKQSNRESARRSRLRKQAETEELAQKVEILRNENLALKSEISQLSKNSTKLRQENSALLDKLNNVRSGLSLECPSDKVEDETSPTAGTENFLAKINESTSISRSEQQENETRDNSGKLRQLLESSPRADAVIAG